MCNRDCFNCQYEDCIEDDLTTDDYKSDEVEQFINQPTKKLLKQREIGRNNMRRRRIADPELDKRYYTEHREQEIKRNSEAKKKNREYYNTYQRELYARNREEMCRKRREYRARKKAERVS